MVHGAINGSFHALREEVLDIAERIENIEAHFRYSSPSDIDRKHILKALKEIGAVEKSHYELFGLEEDLDI